MNVVIANGRRGFGSSLFYAKQRFQSQAFRAFSDDAKKLPQVFFDVSIDGNKAGRIEMELRSDVAPKTCENFRQLCTGEAGSRKMRTDLNDPKVEEVPLHYKNSIFHRVIPQFMLQGGDFQFGAGYGGESIYGNKFEDESFELKHDEPFLLSMANSGKNTNGSQFFITTVPCEWLDGAHVVFGRVVGGQDVVKVIESHGSSNGTTSAQIEITDCGEL